MQPTRRISLLAAAIVALGLLGTQARADFLGLTTTPNANDTGVSLAMNVAPPSGAGVGTIDVIYNPSFGGTSAGGLNYDVFYSWMPATDGATGTPVAARTPVNTLTAGLTGELTGTLPAGSLPYVNVAFPTISPTIQVNSWTPVGSPAGTPANLIYTFEVGPGTPGFAPAGEINAVPEPASIALIGLGGLLLVPALRRARRNASA